MRKLALLLFFVAFAANAQTPAAGVAAPQAAVVAPAVPASTVITTPVSDLLPPAAWTVPSDAIGFAGGEVHGLAKLLAILTTAMGAMRILAEVLSKVALLTGNVQASAAAQMASTGLSYMAWFGGIFSLGAPKSIPGHAQIQASLASKPDAAADPVKPAA